MNENKKHDGALCADGQTGDAAGAAPVAGKKKYMPPTCKVFKLDCGLLATSGMSGDPLYVTVFLGIDYYVGASGKQGREMVDLVALSKLTCDDLRPPAMARYSNSVKCGCGDPNNYLCFGYDFSIDGPDDLDDFLANVQFDEDCSFELPRAYNTDPLVVDSSFGATGTYRGRPVILDWNISVYNSGASC